MKRIFKIIIPTAVIIALIIFYFVIAPFFFPSIAPSIVKADPDGDGLYNDQELELGTDPQNPDTDNDGLNDGDEVEMGTSPVDFDTDNDGLGDGRENEIKTDPKDLDSDDDGLEDGWEVSSLHTDPLKADTDGDKLTDKEETTYGTDPLMEDTDNDGASDYNEIYVRKTDPLSPDVSLILTIRDSGTSRLVEGVTVYIDGKKVDSTTQQGTVMLDTVSIGQHKVSITYETFGEIEVAYISVNANTHDLSLDVDMPNPDFQVTAGVSTTLGLGGEYGHVNIELANTGEIASQDTIALVFVYLENDASTPIATDIVNFGNVAAGAVPISKEAREFSEFVWGTGERVAVAIVDRWEYTPQNNDILAQVQVPVDFSYQVAQYIVTYVQEHPEIIGTIAQMILV
jgi:hypothetical protein